jgi:precorrin-6x reductase
LGKTSEFHELVREFVEVELRVLVSYGREEPGGRDEEVQQSELFVRMMPVLQQLARATKAVEFDGSLLFYEEIQKVNLPCTCE